MSDSILTSVKKNLGIVEADESFDPDVLMHINSVFSTLNQIGLGPDEGFRIEDKTAMWVDFLADDYRLNSVKTYMSLRVRLLFDPPATSYAINAIKEEIKEFEWRLNVRRETTEWTDPRPPEVADEEILILDGGTA